MSNQLIKTTGQGKENVFPRTRIQDLFDDTSGQKLIDILRSFNMMFVPYLGNKSYTRNQISPELRRQGLWLTYVIDNTVYTEWYGEVAIDDTNWGSDSNWRQGSNALVGDLSISPNGTWVINGEDSGITIKGDKGDSPVIRIYDNKIQVSYDKGVTYEDLNNTPVYTKFRFNSQTNTYQVSYDLGDNWQDISNEKVYHKFKYNQATNTYQESIDFGKTWSNISAEKVYTKFRFNKSTNTYQVSTDLGQNWTDVSSDKVYYQFRYNRETNTHQVSTDFGTTWTNVSEDKVFYQFRTEGNRLQVSTDLGTTWENCSEPIAAWFRWADVSGTGNVGKVQISRDNNTWEDLSPTMTNNLYIKGYVATVGDLPTSSAAIGDIYMVGPTYDESDTTHNYPHYRMWVKQSSGWVDNGEYQSNVQISQTTGQETGITMSQKAITDTITEEKTAINEALDRKVDGVYEDSPEYVRLNKDTDERILNGIKTDGTNYLPKADIDTLSLEGKEVDNDSVLAHKYIESPEFIKYYCDADGRLLWWIYPDGSVDWAKGVPQPVQVELRRLEQLISEGDSSITEQIEAINKYLDETIGYKDSPEYIKVEKDADGRVINAITTDGTNYLPKANIDELSLGGGVLDNDAAKSHTYTENPEFIDVVKDADGRVIEAIKSDGTKVFDNVETNTLNTDKVVTKTLNISGEDVDADAVTSNKYEDSSEFIRVEKDADDRILSCTKSDGSHYIHNVESETIPTEFSDIDDIENRMEMNKDADGRIIAYRDSNGKLYENAGIETPIIDAEIVNADSLTLSKVGLTEFEQALKENGFTGGQGDWSTASSLHIPEPRCAMINITSANGSPYSWPTSKFVNKKVWVEFYDMQGNYFKKRAIHNAQGNSSMAYIKKNGAFDFCNDEWIGDDTFSVKFGDWVYQDSFHTKAYYTDFFKGVSVVAYKVADQVEKSRGIFSDRPWKKALLKDYVFGSDQTNSAQINDISLQMNNEAKCHPDGFPCIIYLDGKFYGIYAFCLKKHRDNYHMKKDVAEHVHLDGELHVNYLFGGNIDWSMFEIRNPKNLYYKEAQNGTFKYDADVAQAEIAGDDEVNAWIAAGQLPDGTAITSKIQKRLQTTAKVKNYIINLSQRVNQIKAASTTEEKKALFETYFDVDNLVDYEIVQMATGDTDSFSKNWQWTTYDGIKWWVNKYDKDMSFGGYFNGMYTQPVPTKGGWMGNDINQPIGQLISLYQTEIINRWKLMVDKGIFSVENFLNLFNDWLNRIGTDNFKKEYEKWIDAPCNRDDKVDTAHWKRTNYMWYNQSLDDYDNTKTYMPGEKCYYDLKERLTGQFICVSKTTGNPPLKGTYSDKPYSLGYRDSIWRLTNYISQRLEKENEFINNNL